MEPNKTTYEVIMENSPFLKSLIQDKIAEEVGKKDLEITTLKEELTATKDELSSAKARVTGTEDAINMILGGM